MVNTLLATNDVGLLHETKQTLSRTFEIKGLDEASFVLGVEIYIDMSTGVLELSQRTYINRVLQIFNMNGCSLSDAPIVKEDKFSKSQCQKDSLTKSQGNECYMCLQLAQSMPSLYSI